MLGSKLINQNKAHFRVWAPNATKVNVVGDFNNWDINSDPLNKSGEYWQGEIDGLESGDRYKYILDNGSGNFKYRIDPATRDTESSQINSANNHGLLVDSSYTWSNFETPRFNDLIIYQCHLGSFCGRNDSLHRNNWTATFQDAETKLDYIHALGFNAIALLPLQEYRGDRSWGYNPSFYFAIESSYGNPATLRHFVDACHKKGIAVIFDVVYNHISNIDNSFWHFDEHISTGKGSYMSDFKTPWGNAPALWKQGIKDFFYENMKMYFDEYNADGLRFDATRYLEYNKGQNNDGWEFMQYLTYLSKQDYPSKYLIAEHVPEHDSIINSAGFHATWNKMPYGWLIDALNGNNPVEQIKKIIGKDFGPGQKYHHSWNLIKYLMGSHDESGDMNNGDNHHRYFIEKLGGRNNWLAKAKSRLAWVLNISALGTPMMFMGNECNMYGYWHDSEDRYGDHRFDWNLTRDLNGIAMIKLVRDANNLRWSHPAMRTDSMEITHEDYDNNIIAFKRWNNDGDVVFIIINVGDSNFENHSYGIKTRQYGQWSQVLCSQDKKYGGWQNAGNAYYQPWTQNNGHIYINVPKWSALVFKLLD